MEPGIYPGLPRTEYERLDAVNYSVLRHFKRTPAHAREYQLNGTETTGPMELGTLIHFALLEPERFRDTTVVMPDFTVGLKDKDGNPYLSPRATKAYKQKVADFQHANIDKTIIDPADRAVCLAIGEAVAGHETAASLLDGDGRNEVGIVWEDPETGLLCKGLIDRLTGANGRTVLVDLKSAEDAGPGSFARSCAALGYHLQLAFYGMGLVVHRRPPSRLLHVVCETVPPHAVAVYELDSAALDQGYREVRAHLNDYAACLKAGRWPGYPDRIEPLSLPRYAMTRDGLDTWPPGDRNEH